MADSEPGSCSEHQQLLPKDVLLTPDDEESDAREHRQKSISARVVNPQRLPLLYLSKTYRLMQQSIDRIKNLLHADRIQEQRRDRENNRPYKVTPTARTPFGIFDQSCAKL